MIASPLLFFGIIITGVVTWQAGIYPAWTGVVLVIAALAGLMAVLVVMPPWLRVGTTVLYSATIAYLGFVLMVKTRP